MLLSLRSFGNEVRQLSTVGVKLIEILACVSSNKSNNHRIRWSDWIKSMDTVEGRPLANSEDKYRRVCRKLIHHHAYRTKPYLTETSTTKCVDKASSLTP
jgi:hypothetical protein